MLSHAGETLAIWCRSREGAWIEIKAVRRQTIQDFVAPARERGLKYRDTSEQSPRDSRRSREGAWIEMQIAPT